jgi:hypothetical protein
MPHKKDQLRDDVKKATSDTKKVMDQTGNDLSDKAAKLKMK